MIDDNTTMVRINYRGQIGEEMIEATLLSPTLVELKGFAEYIALMPGDMLLIDENGVAQEVVSPVNEYLVEVFFRLDPPCDEEQVHTAVATWRKDFKVAERTRFALVRTPGWEWVEKVVLNTPGVHHVNAWRGPDDVVSLGAMIEAAIGDIGMPPK